jgi:O-6-methylguanine DNA methyltransferase
MEAKMQTETETKISSKYIKTPVGKFWVEADGNKIDSLSFVKKGRKFPRPKDNGFDFSVLEKQLKEYFEGIRTEFNLPLNWDKPQKFHKRVLKELNKVPYGKTLSYKELAILAGSPKASRAVGQVMAKNPFPIVVPCHRVLASSGKLGGYGGGLDVKVRLLELEKS